MYYGCVGMDREDIDTPALLLDLDLLEKNIRVMAEHYRDRKHVALRPHQKGHRLPIIARKQIDAGAIGVSMTSLGLAEYYVDCGINDIFITCEISGRNKIKRLCNLSKHANVIVSVDNIENVRQLSEEALLNNVKLNVAVELWMNPGSAGVDIREAKQFVKELLKYNGVYFRGLWWHEGHLVRIKSWLERKEREFQILDEIAILKDEIEDEGINVEMLSGGFTATWNITSQYTKIGSPPIELQPGNYVLMDWCSRQLEGLEVFECALTVLTRCISTPKPGIAIFDFGMNSCADEDSNNYHAVVGPIFKDLEGVKEVYLREEIAVVRFEDPNVKVKVGEVYEVIPPHGDTTAKLHDVYYCMRKGKVEAIWPNYGRGLL